MLELATVPLPTGSPAELASWFDQEGVHSLDRYLEAFDATVSALQSSSNIERVTYENAIDLAADGVVYAELRFAPSLATLGGLSIEEVLIAIDTGLERAEREVPIHTSIIADAMRQESNSLEVVKASVAADVTRLVGFDLAGPEAGFPPTRHRQACDLALEAALGLTIHAGEGDGVSSIAAAIGCGAQRIGHGVRIIEDCHVVDNSITDLGPVAADIFARQIPLELCPTSNRHTLGIEIVDHPIDLLYRAGFRVTVNTDNRLMSRTTMTDEFTQLAFTFGWSIQDFQKVAESALQVAFDARETAEKVLTGQVKPGYGSFS